MKALSTLSVFALLLLCAQALMTGPSETQAAQDFDAHMEELDRQFLDLDGRIERAAAKACRDAYGEGATHAWADGNALVCNSPTVTKGAL